MGCLNLTERKELDHHFKKLNHALERSSYLAGDQQTAADVLLFHGIHSVISEMGFQEKERYINLSRWFRALQEDFKLREGGPVLDLAGLSYTNTHCTHCTGLVLRLLCL